ncbi:hypothetical protein GW17_00029186, partial [Ensete ventricosum]
GVTRGGSLGFLRRVRDRLDRSDGAGKLPIEGHSEVGSTAPRDSASSGRTTEGRTSSSIATPSRTRCTGPSLRAFVVSEVDDGPIKAVDVTGPDLTSKVAAAAGVIATGGWVCWDYRVSDGGGRSLL